MKIVIPGFGHALLLLVARCAPIATKIFISGFAFAPLSEKDKSNETSNEKVRLSSNLSYLVKTVSLSY